MHEFSLATQVVESVMEFADAHPDAEVLNVRLQIGELTCVEPDQLKFCYHSITRETPLASSKLEVESINAVIRCPHCSYLGAPSHWGGPLVGVMVPLLRCPRCQSIAEAIKGHECELRSVRLSSNLRKESAPS